MTFWKTLCLLKQQPAAGLLSLLQRLETGSYCFLPRNGPAYKSPVKPTRQLSDSCVCVLRGKSLTFIGGYWAQRGCSLVLWFFLWISRGWRKVRGFGGYAVASRLFADDELLLASLLRSHQYTLGWLSIRLKGALCSEWEDCFLWVGSQLLPQVEMLVDMSIDMTLIWLSADGFHTHTWHRKRVAESQAAVHK